MLFHPLYAKSEPCICFVYAFPRSGNADYADYADQPLPKWGTYQHGLSVIKS